MAGFWLYKIKTKKGALSNQLGIPQERNIPVGLLKVIVKAKPGQTVVNPTETGHRKYKFTRLLERRAIFALNLKKMRR